MKKYLLPPTGNFYKANLHCHSTVSDGRWSPEKIKEEYMARGYSIVAYTDHDVMVPHSELAEENFLPLNGVEYEVTETDDREFKFKKTCHMCMIALDPHNLKHVCYHRTKYLYEKTEKYRATLQYDENEPDFEREYTPGCISTMMKAGRDNGFFVTYNHPVWSQEGYEDYMGYNHMHAMEMCNYGCVYHGYNDYNEKEYDDMLKGGKRIFCISTDDNHNISKDSFGGFTMIKADKLEYKTITDALVNGNFYASQGPEIHDFWYEDGKVHITCSDAKKIVLSTGIRKVTCVTSETDEFVNSAEFEVSKDMKYIRVTVTDACGNHANTNAYFTDEFME